MEREPVDFTKGAEEVIRVLADGSSSARKILKALLKTQDPMNSFIDLADMEMRGNQIAVAFLYHGGDIQRFTQALLDRDPEMVKYVNATITGVPPCRRGPDQKRISPADFAVQSALQAQKMDKVTERMDEGAEHVHNFFLGLLKQMQASRKFTTNMRVNLGLEGGYMGVFVIRLAELVDAEGKPYGQQPQDEAKAVQETYEQIAKERGDVAPLPEDVQKAINEGRW